MLLRTCKKFDYKQSLTNNYKLAKNGEREWNSGSDVALFVKDRDENTLAYDESTRTRSKEVFRLLLNVESVRE